jgi:1-acyl-sn-glycerol-3-phosphate acyltransferase
MLRAKKIPIMTPSKSAANLTVTESSTVLPQWAFEAMRPVVRVLSGILWRIRFHGVENIPEREGGLIIVANHQTYIDPFWISIPVKRPIRYLAWDEAFSWPFAGKCMRLLGAWPLQIEGRDPRSIRRSIQWLRSGGTVVIFPEGSRGLPDGSMTRFKPGALRMALESGVPILPVTIRGANRVWPVGRKLPGFAKVDITYHPLYWPSIQSGEETRQCATRETGQLAHIIGSAL